MNLDHLSQLKAIVGQELDGTDLYLVDIELKGDERNRIVWIYIESTEGGVALERCAELSRNIGNAIDEEGLFKGKYRLNISSPGVDKPLLDRRQYYTNRGRKCNVRYKAGSNETSVEGTLKQVDQDSITIDDGKSSHQIPFGDIVETRILVEI